MKVNNTSARDAQAAYRSTTDPSQGITQGQTTGGTSSATSQRADMAVISAQGRRQALALSAVQTASDVDEATVAQLRSEVKSGAYQVNEENLATKLTQPSGIA